MPKITIEISEEAYKKLKDKALSKGLTIDHYIASMIEDVASRRGVVRRVEERATKRTPRGGIPDDFYQAFRRWWRVRDEVPFEEFVKQAVEKGFDVRDVYAWSYKLWDKFEEKEGEAAAKLAEMVRSFKVLLVSELKPKYPKALIKMARASGVRVLEGLKDIALVDEGFYKDFVEKLKRLPREPRGLSESEEKLLRFMRENGLAYLDVDGRWKLC
jgi:hypothetical protein